MYAITILRTHTTPCPHVPINRSERSEAKQSVSKSSPYLLQSTAKPPLVPQRLHKLNSLINRHELAHLLSLRNVAVADVHRAALLLLCADDHDEVVLRELTGANLLLHGVAGDVNIGVEVVRAELLLQLLAVVVGAGHDGHDENLAG
jgi:hypothetical protein